MMKKEYGKGVGGRIHQMMRMLQKKVHQIRLMILKKVRNKTVNKFFKSSR